MESKGHIFRRYDDELRALHGKLLVMGRLVEAQLGRAVEVLRNADMAGARDVIARDADINALDVAIDEELLLMIAKRQPVASDLRELITISKIVNDLERCGDEVRKIGRLALHLYDNDLPPPNPKLLSDVYTLAGDAAAMLHRALAAFDQSDLDQALAVLNSDQELEDAFESALRRLSTYVMEDTRNIGHSVQVTLTLRAIERIGGHAKNLAGYLVFLATGRDVRHEGTEHVERVVNGTR
jgi:phosphate transport system protein